MSALFYPFYQSFYNTPLNTPYDHSLAYVPPHPYDPLNKGVEYPSYDLVLKISHALGFEITPYQPRQAPWGDFLWKFGQIQAITVALSAVLYLGTKLPPKSPARFYFGIFGIVAIMIFPLVYGRTYSSILDFATAGLGFLGSLHIYDLYFLRPPASIEDWSFGRFHCFLFNFPAEFPKNPKHPRLENLKNLKLCGIKMIVVYIWLYGIPPPQFAAQIKNPISWLCYNILFAVTDLMLIGGLIEGNNHVTGIIWGVEMAPLMNNPMAQTNLRLFWANWNFAIQDSLKRIIFALSSAGSSKKKEKVDLKETPAVANNGAIKEKMENGSIPDQVTFSTSSPSGTVSSSTEAPKPKKKTSFLVNAFFALLTFFASGVYHEYLNHFSFGGSDGSNMIFFMSQGLSTIAYAAMRKTFGKQMDLIPSWVAMCLSTGWVWLCCPWFCATFIRQGFLEDLKAIGVFGPINYFVWWFGK